MRDEIEKSEPIRVVLRFANGAERVALGAFGGLFWGPHGEALFELWYEDGTSEIFGFGELFEWTRPE